MSKDRSPRGSCLTTMGTRGTGIDSFPQPFGCTFVARLSCNSMVARDITLPVEPDEAWDALTDPELLEQWFGDGHREAVVEEAEPGERLVFWWWEEGEPGSRVELRLVAVPTGTRVSVREAPVGPFALAGV
jgi:uncharacterized protein YndB with AHSA1/START domain